MTASHPDELIEEIRSKSARVGLAPIAFFAGVSLLAVGLLGWMAEGGQHVVAVGFMLAGLVLLLSLPWMSWWDRQALTTRVHYEFDELGSKVHDAIVRLLDGIQRSYNVWSVRVENRHGDWKRNAGAGVSVDRRSVRIGWGAPPRVITDVRVGHLVISQTTLYFFPDRLLVYGPGSIQAIRYHDLKLDHDTVDFIEEGSGPRDAARVGTTWRFINRDGGPDLRFKENRQLAVMRYGVLSMSSSDGLRFKLHLSKDGLAAGAASLFGIVHAAIEDLRSRGGAMGPTVRSGAIEGDDPIPLAAPAMKAARLGVSALEYRWLSALPEWAVPMIWGLVFALPIVASIFMVARGRNFGTWTFLGVAILFSTCGIPVLARDRQRLLKARADEDAQERRDRFREMLKAEFRSKMAREVDFKSLALEAGVTRDEEDSIADDLYRKMVDRVVADGIITAEERRWLQILAKALRMTPDRWDRLEDEASSARYRQAVSEVLADGVVTPEESQMLDEMRANLGVCEDRWPAGDLLSED